MPRGKKNSSTTSRNKTKKIKKATSPESHTTDDALSSPHYHPSLPPPSSPKLELCLSRILLLRFRQDIARLYSSHLVRVCEEILPVLMLDIVALSSPGWLVANAQSEELKGFMRGCIAMDLRQVGERVGTKSLIWSYTAVRDFVSFITSVLLRFFA